MQTRPVFICGSARVPFVKSFTTYAAATTPDLMAYALQGLVNKMHLQGQRLGDVALGALMNSPNHWNLGRECVLGTTLDPHTPGYTVQRACGTSLEATLQIALKIANHQMDCGIAGGVDSNSAIPMEISPGLAKKLVQFKKAKTFSEKLQFLATLRLSDFKIRTPAVVEPRTHLSMGEHCEKMVQKWGIPREDQDALALRSHQNAALAYREGFFDDLVIEFMGSQRDSLVRADTSMEQLARLRPAFDSTGKGTLTAGNSSPLTDGAAAVFLASEQAALAGNHPVLARFVDAQVAAIDFVHGEGLLMAPALAVSELLSRQNLRLQDFDFYEIHEAFAGQVLCTLKAWESDEYCKQALKRDKALGPIDRTKLNVKGSSIAVGHPFAATGARIVGTLAKLLHEKKGRGLISICTAGGMGVAAILETG